MSKVLLVDDDAVFASSLSVLFGRKGHKLAHAGSLTEARQLLSHNSYDLVLLDVDLPDGYGLALMDELDAASTRIVIVTGNPRVETAVQAANGPAARYLVKPIDPDTLNDLIATLNSGQAASHAPLLSGESTSLRKAVAVLLRIAPSDASVLLTGETGTGKELAARTLHDASGRRGPFVALNCGAVAPELLASQLFGHEKGSFTGATSRHIGVFEQASHGTLFLDEIGEMPLPLQVFLLRALETGSITRVGGSGTIDTPARLVAATNRDPHALVESGQMRADLFYRLADLRVHLPPLRERGDDVVLLANLFIERLNARYGHGKYLDAACIGALRDYAWPGNVRELRSLAQRAYLLQDGPALRIEPERARFRQFDGPGAIAFPIGTSMADIKRTALINTLAHYGNDKTAAARALGISVRTIHNELARIRETSDA